MEKVEIKQLSPQALQDRGVFNWPVWQKEVSRFDWYYDSEEHCLVLEGEVEVVAEGKSWKIKAGDYVIFHKGLSCTWDVKIPIKKHYDFI